MFDAIVLAGGSARRLDGAAKPQLEVGGVRLLDRVLAAVAGARRVVVVGPEQRTRDGGPTPTWCRESPLGGGPVAALAAGLAHTDAPVVVLLAADLPFVAAAVPLLVNAVPAGGVARLCDADGRANHLAAAWERTALRAEVDRLGSTRGVALRTLSDGVPAVDVDDTGGWGRDCDTWAELDAARLRAQRRDAP